MSEPGPDAKQAASARLVTGSIAGHLVSQTLPTILGVGALISVGIIDAYFIGQLGTDQLAAVAFIFPVTTALSSLGIGVMSAIASVTSRALGRGDLAHARGLANLGLLISAALGAAIALFLLLFRDPLFRLMQADPALLPYIEEYMLPFALGFVLLPTMMGVNGALRAQGEAKKSAAILLVMALLNWVLDPILIVGAFGFAGLGIAGAAWATVISWLVTAVVGMAMLQKTDIRFAPSAIARCDVASDARALLRVAGPAAFSNSINPAGLAILTALLASAGPAAVAAFGAGGRLQSFAIVPLLAMSGSIGAIVGQNWGAERFDRARLAMLQAGGFSIVFGTAVGALLVVFSEPIAALFTDDRVVADEIVRYMAISAWGYGGFGVLIIANGALNAIDRATMALAQSIARVLLVMIPVALLLPASFGASSIYYAELASNLFGGLLAAAMVAWVFSAGKLPRPLQSAEATLR